MKLVLGITSAGSGPLIKGQPAYFRSLGYKVYLMAPPDERIKCFCKDEGCEHIPVSIERTISPLKDIWALIQIIKALKKVKPDIVNVGTPKMGLLGTMAAAFIGVKKRIYTCRGFRYEHERGLKRKVLMFSEKTASALAHKVVCISPSLRERGIADRIFPGKKAVLIGHGSSNGIDLYYYNPGKIPSEKTSHLKKSLGLNQEFVYGFVGRLLDRKGLRELYEAFSLIYEKDQNTALIILGGITKDQFSDDWLIEKFRAHPGIQWLGFRQEVPLYMSTFDVLVLPAWWEGFGNVLIQSAAMGVPVISTFGTGCRDAVNNGYNGTLVPVKDVNELTKAMVNYMENRELRKKHGNNGIKWAQNFRSEIIWEGLNELYSS